MERYSNVKEAEKKVDCTIEKKDGELFIHAFLTKVKEEATSTDKFFSKITSDERNEVFEWMKKQKFNTQREKDFFKLLDEALKNVRYDYYISNMEPSVDEQTGELVFEEGKPVAVGYSCNQLKEMCKAYNPERFSRMSDLYELIIWYAYRIVKGFWSLNFVTTDSFGGNYSNAPDATHCLEKTGARICGGYKDGVGNTYKIVIYKKGFAGVGCCYKGESNQYPVADVDYNGQAFVVQNNGTTHVTLLTKKR